MSDLFDRARDALAIEELAGRLVKLTGRGDERRGPCPICRAGEQTGSTPFKISVGRQDFKCFGCDERGDVADLYAKTHGLTTYEAAKILAGGDVMPDRPRVMRAAPPPSDKDREARILKMSIQMWRGAEPFAGSPAETYLAARGVDAELLGLVEGLRFHPAAPHHFDDQARAWVRAPAMIARAETAAGWEGGVHVTYLAADGSRKADLQPAKRMWGPQGSQTGLGLVPGGAWLMGRDAEGDLVLGEGIETTLSLATWLKRQGRTVNRVAAALSLNRLQGGVRRDADGCMDVDRPDCDPDHPPFLWGPCDTAYGTRGCGVFLAIDRDMGPVRVRGRSGRGKPLWFVLDAEARARLCARLASRAWRARGWAFASPMWPAIGGDWNDLVRVGA